MAKKVHIPKNVEVCRQCAAEFHRLGRPLDAARFEEAVAQWWDYYLAKKSTRKKRGDIGQLLTGD